MENIPDTDNDGVPDSTDQDDDNDGILDIIEANQCNPGDPTVDAIIFTEDFGTANGTRAETPFTNYLFEDGTGSAGADSNLQDGEYTIFEDIEATAAWASDIWQNLGDHSTGNDRMAIFNANNAPGLEFYRRPLTQVVAGVPLTVSLWAMNIDIDIPSSNGRNLPDLTITIEQGGTAVFTFNTGPIGREALGDPAAWKNFTGTFTPSSSNTLELVIVNNAPGGGGNDLALDDIVLSQPFCDNDGDGIPNDKDLDADNDGIPDAVEAQATDSYIAPGAIDATTGIPAFGADIDGLDTLENTDNNGLPDYLDLDSDNDGIFDIEESDNLSLDTDGDGRTNENVGANGLTNSMDTTDDYSDADGQLNDPNLLPNDQNSATPEVDYRDLPDNDQDGIPDGVDLDDDNDGIPDLVENDGNDPFMDTDNDGTPDYLDTDVPNFVDANNDGINDTFDKDQDGVLDQLDTDADNDGIPDVIEAGGADNNGDGRIDDFTDTNDDGLDDATAITPLATPDTDGDGRADYKDLDADNDGTPDVIEAGGSDSDGNGQLDSFTDVDNDGLSDIVDTLGPNTPGTALEDPDSDGDGLKDRLDTDADNDGITDVLEAGGTDADGDGIIDSFTDTDNDGLADSVDPEGPNTPGTPLENPDTDTDGIVDRIDVDADNDGISDATEAGGIDADGDGRLDDFMDADNDGLADAVDPDDNTTPATADGSGIPLPVNDFDGDGRPNHLDIDADNDGITDTEEAGGLDADGDGQIDGFIDTDGDGLDDATATIPLPVANTDNNLADGPNYLDIDADDDGIPDNIEGQTTQATLVQATTIPIMTA